MNENQDRNRFLDFLLAFFIYLFFVSLPLDAYISNAYLVFGIRIGFGVIFIILYSFYLSHKYPQQNSSISPKSLIFFLPFFIIPFSNIIAAASIKEASSITDLAYLTLKIIQTILFAICEELLFRRCLIAGLKNRGPDIMTLLVSSALFALLHLFNALNGENIGYIFVQLLYTFGIGLILGEMYLYGKTLILPILFHSFFNIFENDLYNALYPSSDYSNVQIIVSVIFAIFGLAYGIFIYFYFREPTSKDKQDK